MNIRIIPRLDIKGPNLVKGIHLEGLRVLGKPWEFALKYYQAGADELIYMDIVASLYGRNNLSEIVSETARNIFIPLTVGGGIRTIEDIRALLRAGADKVAINTAAVQHPELIREGARIFGSQCIVVSIEARTLDGRYEALTDNGRERTHKDAVEWARQAVDLGAGELLITSVDREGTGSGYDLELIRRIASSVPVPVIACGGCGKPEHLIEGFKEARADALCASSIFHYHYLETQIEDRRFEEEGNIEFLLKKRGELRFMPNKIIPMGIHSVKEVLSRSGINCRLDGSGGSIEETQSDHSRLRDGESLQHRKSNPICWGTS